MPPACHKRAALPRPREKTCRDSISAAMLPAMLPSFLHRLRRRSLLAYGLSAIGVLLLLLLALPYFVPLERVQQAAAVKISGLTGQEVTFSGAVRHFSLPFPYFTLRNVQVAGSNEGPA